MDHAWSVLEDRLAMKQSSDETVESLRQQVKEHLSTIATLRALSAQLRTQTESLAEMWIALRRVVAA